MPLPSANEKPLLTVPETAAEFNVSTASIYRAVQRGDLPAVRVGRSIRIPVAALRKLLQLDAA